MFRHTSLDSYREEEGGRGKDVEWAVTVIGANDEPVFFQHLSLFKAP